MAISVGTQAPDFTLKSKNADGVVDISLSNNKGQKNTVLLFFPLAFTGVCTSELCDVTAGLSQYSDLNADVIGISVDSPFAQEAWAQKENIGITLASDLNKKNRCRLRSPARRSARFWLDKRESCICCRQARGCSIRRANPNTQGSTQL